MTKKKDLYPIIEDDYAMEVNERAQPYGVETHEITDPDDPRFYPESDGLPMSENTLHFTWIVSIYTCLNLLFKDREDVFLASDLFWYPVYGNPKCRRSPDVMVAFGRPKRNMIKVGSYMQWREESIAPQVVFEVKSPSDDKTTLREKREFYQEFDVEEYYLCDPDKASTRGWIRTNQALVEIDAAEMNGWQSPRLGIRFQEGGLFNILNPDGSPFISDMERNQQQEQKLLEKDRELELMRQELARMKASR